MFFRETQYTKKMLNLQLRAVLYLYNKQQMIEFKEVDNKLYAKFTFNDFNSAMEFINKVALVAEQLNHHPTIHNTYNKVELFLSTHDAGGVVTEKDWELAREIMKIEKYK